MSTDVPTPRSPIDRLRDQLDRDARILQALASDSEAHQRLSARIEAQTRQLLDRIDEKEAAERRYREAMRADQARRDATALSPDEQARVAGGVFVLIGGGIVYIGWGTWWLALAGLMIALGLLAIFVLPESDSNPR